MARTLIRAHARAPWAPVPILLLLCSACPEPEESTSSIEHDPNCGQEVDTPFEVEAVPLEAEGLADIEQIADEAGLMWITLTEAERCELACVYLADELDHYLDGQSTVDDGCVLDLEYEESVPEAPLLVGSDVTCSGVFRHTVPCL